MKCRQIACGSIFYDEIDEEKMEAKLRWSAVHDEKLEALSDLLEEIDRPALVMYQFRHERERIEEFLKKFFKTKEIAVLGAGVGAAKAREYVERWNSGKLPVLLGHPTSMGHGLNLQGGGDVLIWMSQTWSQEEYEQTIKRLARQGSKFSSIFNYLIVARNTVDEAMQLAVALKTKTQKSFLDSLKRYRVAKK
jgi:SNF2 family DNA or RNA helicase